MLHYDFHVHTSERSTCAIASQTEQIQTAIRSGLHAVAITDHFKLVPDHELARLNRIYAPFQIMSGIEITANGEDWLVLGLSDPALETEKWTYPLLHQFVRRQGGVLVLAHPFRYHPVIDVDLVKYPPHAVELRSNNIRVELVPKIKDLADQLHVPTLCNSDAHSTGSIGRYYNISDRSVMDSGDIFGAIKSGSLRPSVS